MNELDQVITNYYRLISLLDEEYAVALRCFQGDILEAYRNLLRQERTYLLDALHSLIYHI